MLLVSATMHDTSTAGAATLFSSCESVFKGNRFLIRQRFLTLPWREYYIEHRSGARLAFARRKYRSLFNLRTAIRVYSDQTVSTELLSIQQHAAFEWRSNFEVVDSTTGQLIGAIRRNVLGPFAAREWSVVGPLGQELGTITKKSYLGLFAIRRHFSLKLAAESIEIAVETRRPFCWKISLDVSAIPSEVLDRRLAIAFGLLVLAADSRN